VPEPTDRVQVLKQESSGGGGDDADFAVLPSPIEAQEDAIESAGHYFQDASNRDESTLIHREGDDMRFKDSNNPSGHTLSALASSGLGLDYATITTEGGLIYDSSGNFVIKDTP
jgi:hypothetical protein